MKNPETNQTFKLNVLSIFRIEALIEKKLSFSDLCIVIAIILAFVMLIILVFKWYAITGISIGAIGNKILKWATAFARPRSP